MKLILWIRDYEGQILLDVTPAQHTQKRLMFDTESGTKYARNPFTNIAKLQQTRLLADYLMKTMALHPLLRRQSVRSDRNHLIFNSFKEKIVASRYMQSMPTTASKLKTTTSIIKKETTSQLPPNKSEQLTKQNTKTTTNSSILKPQNSVAKKVDNNSIVKAKLLNNDKNKSISSNNTNTTTTNNNNNTTNSSIIGNAGITSKVNEVTTLPTNVTAKKIIKNETSHENSVLTEKSVQSMAFELQLLQTELLQWTFINSMLHSSFNIQESLAQVIK